MSERYAPGLKRIGVLLQQLEGEVDSLRALDDAVPAQPMTSRERPADIAEFAVRVAGAWEGNTFGWHGAPGKSAFGIIGFEGDMAGRLRAFARQRGHSGLMDDIAPELQLEFASDYFRQIDAVTCAPRGLRSLAGRVMAFDMAVNNGKYHPFFAEADRELGLTNAAPPSYHGYVKTAIAPGEQAAYLLSVAQKRIDMRRHLFGRYPGLEARYQWWRDVLAQGFSDPLRIQPRQIAIPLPCPAAMPKGPRWGSPVNPGAQDCVAPGWLISQGYGDRFPEHPLVPKWMWGLAHSGLDFNTFPDDYGLPVHAAAGGRVSCARDLGGTWGNVVALDHGDNTMSRYAHLSRMNAQPGQLVERGARLGEIGDAGGALPAHLHFDICVSGILRHKPGFNSAFKRADELARHFTDPIRWINERGHWL